MVKTSGKMGFSEEDNEFSVRDVQIELYQMEKLKLVVEYMNLEFNGKIRPRSINLRIICT